MEVFVIKEDHWEDMDVYFLVGNIGNEVSDSETTIEDLWIMVVAVNDLIA